MQSDTYEFEIINDKNSHPSPHPHQSATTSVAVFSHNRQCSPLTGWYPLLSLSSEAGRLLTDKTAGLVVVVEVT